MQTQSTPETAKPDRCSLIVYLCTAAVLGSYLLSPRIEAMTHADFWLRFLASWSISFGIPLLFGFAYPRYVFEFSSGRRRTIGALVLNVGGFISVFIVFLWLASPLPEAHHVRQSFEIPFSFIVLGFLLILLTSALFLLLRRRFSLGSLAAILIWPCLLFFATTLSIPYWGPAVTSPTRFFLCFCSCFLLAFAAGTLPFSQQVAHGSALAAGCLAMLWLYWREFMPPQFENAWILLNVSDREAGPIQVHVLALAAILTVALLVFCIVVSSLRLLPVNWHVRGSSLRHWNWPALLVSLAVLGVWFGKSVTPYRIPGAATRIWPMLEILHIEKHGLQLHETCIHVERDGVFYAVHNDRRLLQYKFVETTASGMVPEAVMQQAAKFVKSMGPPQVQAADIRSLHSWNAEGWYIGSRGVISAHTSENKLVPPAEAISIFNQIISLPAKPFSQTARMDVCLGFCYDPLASLGYLYANERCRNAGSGFRCR
jgi:hypothetical protein